MILKADSLLETIFRNYCFKQTQCNGCMFKHEGYSVSNSKNSMACLVGKMCIMDIIGKEDANCEDCVFKYNKVVSYYDSFCLPLQENNIKHVKYFGYCRFKIKDE